LRYLDRLQPLALLVMRLALGAVMVGHGYHKVFGGLHHHVQFVASLGLPGWTAYLSAFAEFFGGLLVLIGLMGDHGYEFPLALAALAFALTFFGGGPIAVDHIRAPGGGGKAK
jgi:putative oxidoreductase